MRAVILAGGKGERLKPLTVKIPKAMALVGNIPILEHNLNLLKEYGINKIIICTGYHSDKITKYFADESKFGVKITYSHESTSLGTAGAVGKLRNQIKDDFLVCYSDVLINLDIKKFLLFHKQKKGIGSICVYQNSKSDPKSNILFNKEKGIIDFTERPLKKKGKFIWSNASYYIFKPEIFSFIPKDINCDFGKDIFPSILKNGQKMYAYEHDGYFLDIGNNTKLKLANDDFHKGILI